MAQAVHLIDDHAVDLIGFDVGQEPFERRTLHAATGEAVVVVEFRQADPTLVLVAQDVCFGAFPLGAEGG